MSRTLWRSLFVFDPRPAGVVEDDVRAEIDAHLAMIEDELISQGMPAAAAREQARARFGDAIRITREGRNIKLGDRIMLQRINLALLVVLGAAVVFLLVQNQRISNRSVATLEQVAASLAAMQQRQPAPEAAATPQRPPSKLVYIEGTVARPGSYMIPAGGLTLRRLIDAAGGLNPEARTVYLDHQAESETDTVLSVSNMAALNDPYLKADDVVTVTNKDDHRAPWMIKVDRRGYVMNSSTAWVPIAHANLADFLVGHVDQAGTLVRIDRTKPEAWSKTLPITQATGDAGRAIALMDGDVVTVLGPEADAAVPEDWKEYKRSEQASSLALGDQHLANLLRQRELADSDFAQLREQGYPVGHRRIAEARARAQVVEADITQRVRELLKPAIDQWMKSDAKLRDLVNNREKLEAQLKQDIIESTRAGKRNPSSERRPFVALDAQINARVEELTKSEHR